jgi:hypothetical protein
VGSRSGLVNVVWGLKLMVKIVEFIE